MQNQHSIDELEEFMKNKLDAINKGFPVMLEEFNLPQALLCLCNEIKKLRFEINLRNAKPK